MSLFHSPRDRRLPSSRKRRKYDQAFYSPVQVKVENFSCDYCDNEYESETELHLHKNAKHRTEVQKIYASEMACKICITKQETYEQLVKHVKSTHLLSSEDAEYVEREIFVCDTCHLIFFNKEMLAFHVVFQHDPIRKQKMTMDCPKCGKSIHVKQAWFHFQRHLIQNVTCCPICLHKCQSRRDLSEHVKEHPSYYHCTLCAYDTKIKHSFDTHMKTHKKGFESFHDAIVGRCFIPTVAFRKNTYNFGLRGLQLYTLAVCVLCRAICTSDSAPDHVRIHLLKHVVTKREYTCVCGESFFNAVLLKHHVFKLKGDHKASEM